MCYFLLSQISEAPALNSGELKNKYKEKKGKKPLFHHISWIKKLAFKGAFQLSNLFAYLQGANCSH